MVAETERAQCALDNGIVPRGQATELDLGATAKALLTGTVGHLQGQAENVEPSVHRLVENGRRDLWLRDCGIDGERELDKAKAGVREIGAPAWVTLDEDARKVSAQVPAVVWGVPIDQVQGSVEADDDVCRRDLRTGIADCDGETADLVSGREEAPETQVEPTVERSENVQALVEPLPTVGTAGGEAPPRAISRFPRSSAW